MPVPQPAWIVFCPVRHVERGDGRFDLPGLAADGGAGPFALFRSAPPRATVVVSPVVAPCSRPSFPKPKRRRRRAWPRNRPRELPKAATQVTPPPVETAPPEVVISPQMLLKYFAKPTNSVASGDAPLEFTPPKPVEGPPSRATYETGP